MVKKADAKDIERMVVIKHDRSLPSCANNLSSRIHVTERGTCDGDWQVILVEDRDGNHEAIA